MNQSLSAAEYLAKKATQRRTRRLIIGVAIFYAVLGAIFWYQTAHGHVGPEGQDRSYTIEAGNFSSITGFLEWLGLTRIAPPDVLWQDCNMRGQKPLGIWQNQEGQVGVICYDPEEAIDLDTCHNWGLERGDVTEKTITCIDRRPRA